MTWTTRHPYALEAGRTCPMRYQDETGRWWRYQGGLVAGEPVYAMEEEEMPGLWTHIHHRDRRALTMADRHYSRQHPGSPEFTRPGHKIVLMHFAPDGSPAALWASQRPAPSANVARSDGLDAWDCAMFRIEQRTAVRASDLITAAVRATMALWGELPRDGFVTTIDPRKVVPIKVRGVPTWGYSYLKAGWTFLRITKSRKLIMLQLPRHAMAVLNAQAPDRECTQIALFEVSP